MKCILIYKIAVLANITSAIYGTFEDDPTNPSRKITFHIPVETTPAESKFSTPLTGKTHEYITALMFIGAAHRKSIMQKIQRYDRTDKLKLNWTFYKNQGFNQG